MTSHVLQREIQTSEETIHIQLQFKMCLAVFQVYKVGSDSFDTYDQHYGRGLVKDTIKEGEINHRVNASYYLHHNTVNLYKQSVCGR